MAAVVQIHRLTGAGPSNTDITSINTRANAADAHSTNDTASPIQVPDAGSNYSYKVSTQLNVISGLTGTINNLRWFTDGANGFGTGVTCQAKASASYTQATGSAGTGAQMTGGSDAFGYTSASPLAVTGTKTASTGLFGYVVEYQIVVGTTAGPGATNAETFSWKYDEA